MRKTNKNCKSRHSADWTRPCVNAHIILDMCCTDNVRVWYWTLTFEALWCELQYVKPNQNVNLVLFGVDSIAVPLFSNSHKSKLQWDEQVCLIWWSGILCFMFEWDQLKSFLWSHYIRKCMMRWGSRDKSLKQTNIANPDIVLTGQGHASMHIRVFQKNTFLRK